MQYKIGIKQFLIDCYLKQKLSIANISIMLQTNFTYIRNNLLKYKIKIRNLSQAGFERIYSKKFIFTKKQLIKLYIRKHLSTLKIAEIFNCSATTVNNNLKLFKIKRHRLDYPSSFKGCHHTNKNKKILSQKHKGLRYNISKKTQQRLSLIRSKLFTGKGNGMWQGGLNSKGYYLFTNKLKKLIRDRDEHKCQYCGIKEESLNRKLDVHHIDYDKCNCKETNLIALCNICNKTANANRDYWFAYYNYIMENFVYV